MRFYGVILHEMGHIFGLHHGSRLEIMNANFPQKLLKEVDHPSYFPGYWKDYGRILDAITFFKWPGQSILFRGGAGFGSTASSPFNKFFDLKTARECEEGLNFSIYEDNVLIIFNSKSEEVGRVKLTQSPLDYINNKTPIINVHFPTEQTAFHVSSYRKLENQIPLATFDNEFHFKGQFRSAKTGELRHLTLKIQSGVATLGGVVDGVYYFNFAEGF
jgi:hypothetical protein